MNMLDRLIGVVAPHECLGCGAEGGLICPGCVLLFPDLPERCYRCHQASGGSLTCSSCRQTSGLRHVRAATDYEGIARDLIWKVKFAGARSAVDQMAQCMQPLLAGLVTPDTLIVPAPTATSRARQRGYDQAKLLARQLAYRFGLPYVDCLARHGQSHQVGASREQRLCQLQQAYRVAKRRSVQNAHIFLIDDVLTTGATLEAAAHTLKMAGARYLDAAVFAQA
ncbi:MAG TPA: phosphoribosyltransferase family protein [Verrucomicrobiae bacterium]|nr:phosphoribosyltransferase family protein [Verrucomicrobiae bacterium]